MAGFPPNSGGMSMSNYGYPSPGMGMSSPNSYPSPPPQPANPPAPFVGRYVNALTDILPNEVPMDGRAAIFPTGDLSEIFLKSWSADGSIKTFRYVLDASTDLNASAPPPPDPQYNQLSARIEELEKMVQKASQRKNTKTDGEVKNNG